MGHTRGTLPRLKSPINIGVPRYDWGANHLWTSYQKWDAVPLLGRRNTTVTFHWCTIPPRGALPPLGRPPLLGLPTTTQAPCYKVGALSLLGRPSGTPYRYWIVLLRVTFKGGKGKFPPSKITLPLSNCVRMARKGRGNFPLSKLFLRPFSINSLFRFYSHRYSDSSRAYFNKFLLRPKVEQRARATTKGTGQGTE